MVGKQHSSDLVIADAHDGTKASRLMLIMLAFTERLATALVGKVLDAGGGDDARAASCPWRKT